MYYQSVILIFLPNDTPCRDMALIAVLHYRIMEIDHYTDKVPNHGVQLGDICCAPQKEPIPDITNQLSLIITFEEELDREFS